MSKVGEFGLEENWEEERKKDTGFYAGFILYADNIDAYKRALAMLDKVFGIKLITSKINNDKLYITAEVPKDFKQNLVNWKDMENI